MISCDSHGNSTLTPPPMPGKLRDTQWYVLPGTVRGHSPGHHPCNWVRRLDKSFKVHFVGGLSEPGEHGQCHGCGRLTRLLIMSIRWPHMYMVSVWPNSLTQVAFHHWDSSSSIMYCSMSVKEVNRTLYET